MKGKKEKNIKKESSSEKKAINISSLKFRIILFVIILVTIGTFTLGAISKRTAVPALETSIGQTLEQATDNIANKLNAHNEKIFNILNSLASISIICDENAPVEEKAFTLDKVKESSNDFINLTFCDKNGIGYTHTGAKTDFSQRPYFQNAIKGNNFILDPSLSPVTGDFAMFYSIPVHNRNNEIIGILVAVVDGSALSNFCAETVIGKESHPIIMSMKTGKTIGDEKISYAQEGQILRDTTTGEFNEAINAALNGEKSYKFFYEGSHRKCTVISAYRPVGFGTDWTIFCMAPRSDYFKVMDNMIIKMFLAAFLIVIISGLLVYIVITAGLKPLIDVKDTINGIATGNADLTKRISVKTKDEIGDVVKGFNKFSEKLQTIITGVKNSKNDLINVGSDLQASTQDTTASISQILSNIDDMHKQISLQNNSVQETAGAVNEIASNIESFDRMITQQAESVSQASAAVEEMIGNISSVNNSVEKMAESFEQLRSNTHIGFEKLQDVNEKIDQIEAQSDMLQEANDAIASIASQTNLLAMNAAIEAAHAGEAGKGFSVVADEIGKLSETSQQQSMSISEQLNNIKESINSVVDASEQSSVAFQAVATKIKETDELVRHIKAAMQEQNEGSSQITNALHSMNDSTIEVRTAASEMTEGNKAILKEVSHLQEASGHMSNSMNEMAQGARKINETGQALSGISSKMTTSIDEIGNQIDQFKV